MPKAAMSPSVRRAWIEIFPSQAENEAFTMSPSVRRAWIEIRFLRAAEQQGHVALREEGVD